MTDLSTTANVAAATGRVDLKIDAIDTYYFAAAFRTVVRSISVKNIDVPLESDDVEITVSIESPLSSPPLQEYHTALPVFDPREEKVIRNIRMAPNPGVLSRIDEQLPGEIVATARIAGTVVGSARSPVTFLAFNQWMFQPQYYDTLAAFVQPNVAALRPILSRAREILGRDTGRDSTEGYQTGPDRVAQIAKAVFEALQEQGFKYSNPPASFEGYGQKVRTPEVVVEDRSATCLDSSVLYASCLFAVGLEAYVTVVKGHAFVMYRSTDRVPEELLDVVEIVRHQSVTDNANQIARLVAGGFLQPVETTKLADPKVSFLKARREDQHFFTTGLDEVRAIINIQHARKHGVPAIPSQAALTPQDATASHLDLTAGLAPVDTPVEVIAEKSPGQVEPRRRDAQDDIPPRVASWLRSLLDLSGSNPLLRIGGKSGERSVLRLELPPGLLDALEDRLMDTGSFSILPATDAGAALLQDPEDAELLRAEIKTRGRVYHPDLTTYVADAAQVRSVGAEENPRLAPSEIAEAATNLLTDTYASHLDRSVAGLRRRAREIENQSGANTLFLAIGAVTWTDDSTERSRSADRTVRAPLFLIPIRIKGKAKTGVTIETDETNDVSPNYCLLERLRQSYDITIEDLERPVLDDSGIDVDRMIDKVREALGKANIKGAVVTEDAWIAVLNFSTFRLWKDMREHWETFRQSPVVKHLIDHPNESFVDPEPPVADLGLGVHCPIECDESQLEAVRWAVQGRSFVLEGPPGTGKSQTIANLLAASIAAGKKVLFVAEKQAALGVVKKRLDAVGLGPFCLDLHDKGSKPDQIRSQIRASLDAAPADRQGEWDELIAKWTATAAALTAYRDALHTPGDAGLSAWSAHEEAMRMSDGPAIEVPTAFVSTGAAHLASVRHALLELPRVAGSADLTPSTPWTLCETQAFDAIVLADLEATIRELAAARISIVGLLEEFSDDIGGPNDIHLLAEIFRHSRNGSLLSPAERSVIRSPDWAARTHAFVEQLRGTVVGAQAIFQHLTPSILSTDLAQIMVAGTEALAANMFSRKRKTRAFEALIAPFLATPTELPVADWMAILQSVSTRQSELARAMQGLTATPGLRFAIDFDPLDLQQLNDVAAQANELTAQATLLSSNLGSKIAHKFDTGWLPDVDIVDAAGRADVAWSRLCTALAASPESVQRWTNDRTFVEAWARSEPAWLDQAPRFLALQRWCQVLDTLNPLSEAGLGDIREGILNGRIAPGDAYERFRRGFVDAAFAERLEAGRLDIFDGRAHGRLVEDYAALEADRRVLSHHQIPAELVERRPVKGGRRVGKWGALEQELARKSRKLSIRRLIAEYADILPDLSPCFLMSPDSVARFIPPGAITFDLVVFDEASQIEVARSIGTIGRGRSVVVVGDTQQMPPNRFGASTSAADDDLDSDGDDVLTDLESILSECAESNMPRLYLECHYRSRYEELIAFSNQNFYDSRLTTFPSPSKLTESPIRWRRVDGEFLRSGKREELRTNPVEAQAIVDEIIGRLSDPGRRDQSIAVVTMNVQQQDLIVRLLEESGDGRARQLLEDESEHGLIVRNLESVQGDERDVVIFSIAFSPPIERADDGTITRGRLPLNFGPLNRRGGERRLNVAVTRARSEVVVFCSFDPKTEMILKDSASRGITLLKAYLELAQDGAERNADLQIRTPTPPNPHRTEIAAALRERGLVVKENVGLSAFRVDLAVKTPDREDWQVAVLLDGPGWAARSTAYDRDAMPVSVLHGAMGWPRVERIWLPMWLTNRDEVLDDLVAAVDRASQKVPAGRQDATGNEPTSAAFDPTTEPAGASVRDTADPQATAAGAGASLVSEQTADSEEMSGEMVARLGGASNPSVTPSVSSDGSDDSLESSAPPARRPLGPQEVLDFVEYAEYRALVTQAIDECLDDFAPISAAQLAKIVAGRFGYNRVAAKRVSTILQLVPPELRRSGPFGDFVWSTDLSPHTWTGYRDADHTIGRRPINEIPPEEVINAIVDLVQQGVEMSHEELLRETASLFGALRLTARISQRLEGILSLAVNEGRLSEVDSVYRIASSQ